MDKELFQGTWKLISTKYTSDDGEIVYPLGSKVSGQLIYDNKGNMSAQLYNVKRPKFASEDWKRGTLLEIKAAFESFRSYYGTYDVDEEKKVVTHHVLGHSFPNLVGKDNVRFYKFSDNRLILTTVPMFVFGKNIIGRLVWERL